jgi:hypothetical protein
MAEDNIFTPSPEWAADEEKRKRQQQAGLFGGTQPAIGPQGELITSPLAVSKVPEFTPSPEWQESEVVEQAKAVRRMLPYDDLMQEITRSSKDVPGDIDKLHASVFIADRLGLDASRVMENWDSVATEYWGRTMPPKTAATAIGDMWKSADLDSQIGMLSHRQMMGDTSPELEKQIASLEAQKPSPDAQRRSWPVELFKSSAAVAPYMVNNWKWAAPRVAASAAGAAAVAGAMSGGSAILPTFGVWFARGMVLGGGAYTFQVEGGLNYRNLIKLGIDPDLARRASLPVAAANTVLEMAGQILSPASKAGYNAVMRLVAKDVSKELFIKGPFAALSAKLSSRVSGEFAKRAVGYGVDVAESLVTEPVTETLQEVMPTVGQAWTTEEQNKRNAAEYESFVRELVGFSDTVFAESLRKRLGESDIPQQTREEIIDRFTSTFAETLKGMLVVAPVSGLLGEGFKSIKHDLTPAALEKAKQHFLPGSKPVVEPAVTPKTPPVEPQAPQSAPPASIEQQAAALSAKIDAMQKEFEQLGLDLTTGDNADVSLQMQEEIDRLTEQRDELTGPPAQTREDFEAAQKPVEPAPTETTPTETETEIEQDLSELMVPEDSPLQMDEPGPGEQQGVIFEKMPDGTPIRTQTVKVADIALADDVPQVKGGKAKKNINPATGEVYGQEIQNIDPSTMPPIQLIERLDGRLQVVSGRHRLAALRRSGILEVKAQIVREADGFTPAKRLAFDAEANIRDGKGTVQDYVEYFTSNPGITKETAESRGLLSGALGRNSFAIARDAVERVRDLWTGGELSDSKSAAIASAAPNNDPVQKALLRRAKGLTPEELQELGRLLVARTASPKGSTLDLFGEDDSVMKKQEDIAVAAVKRRGELERESRDLKASLTVTGNQRGQTAEKYSIIGKTTEMRRDYSARKKELDSWSGWETNPHKTREAEILAGFTPDALSPEEQAQYDAYQAEIRRPDDLSGVGDEAAGYQPGTLDGIRYTAKNGYRPGYAPDAEGIAAIEADLADIGSSFRERGITFSAMYGKLGVRVFSLFDPKVGYDPKAMIEFLNQVNLYTNLARLRTRLEIEPHIWSQYTKEYKAQLETFGYLADPKGTARAVRNFQALHGDGVIRDSTSDYEVAMAIAGLPEVAKDIADKQDDFNQAILDQYTETKSAKKASYILTNGTMIAFRAEEHDAAAARNPHKYGMDGASVEWFLFRTGAARFDLANGVAHFVTRPTEAQIAGIAEAFQGREAVLVEVGNASGEQIAFSEVTHPTPTKLGRILSGLDERYTVRDEGEAAFGSDAKAKAAATVLDQGLLDLDGRLALQEAGGSLQWETNPGVSLVAGEWKTARHFDYRGFFVESVRVLAEAWSIYRSATVETFFWIATDSDGNVLWDQAHSSGLQGGSRAFDAATMSEGLQQIKDRMKASGATKLYLLHNHPSGVVAASTHDYALTEAVQKSIPGFVAHLILDGDKFTTLSGDMLLDETAPYAPILTRPDPVSEVAKRPAISGARDAAELGARVIKGKVHTAILVTDVKNRVLAWQSALTPADLKAEAIHAVVRQMGGTYAFVVTDDAQLFESASADLGESQQSSLGEGFDVRDVVLIGAGKSAVRSAVSAGDISPDLHHPDFVMDDRTRTSRVWDERKSYQPNLEPGLHESDIHGRVLAGQWVDDAILEEYGNREWAGRELERRQLMRDDARAMLQAQMFTDANTFAEVMALSDVQGRSRVYFRHIWDTAAQMAGDPLTTGKRFLKTFTFAAAELALHDLSNDTLLGSLDSGPRAALQAQIDALPPIVNKGLYEVREQGALSKETYAEIVKLVAADPAGFRNTLGGLVVKVARGYDLAQKVAEAGVDPDLATFDELKKAYLRASADMKELTGTVGSIVAYSKSLQQDVAVAEFEVVRQRAAYQAVEYIRRLVSEIMRPVSYQVSQVYAEKIIAAQQSFVVKGGTALKATQEKIKATIQADPSKAISASAEKMLKAKALDDMGLAELEQIRAEVQKLRTEGREIRLAKLVDKHQKQFRMAKGALDNIVKARDQHHRVPRGHQAAPRQRRPGSCLEDRAREPLRQYARRGPWRSQRAHSRRPGERRGDRVRAEQQPAHRGVRRQDAGARDQAERLEQALQRERRAAHHRRRPRGLPLHAER